ncbi:arachidonate 15-lipoxygenase [Variovorax boronicumulans]|uniref:Arachidonate 15-lipoxygenase n=1 Tax=Variovorax boronicumulans TaxID=436515 RepID=A0AAW8CUT9_9BURK|nr:lipoxygenase family protein [Variovorax boronicumulans]MDP9895183.1 arachidonate 15-lipoxygenase [Variovorax boronicumulans]MDQ0055001.1 arachidonate 15-lipoxygenase [Variovorax boronicumulans]
MKRRDILKWSASAGGLGLLAGKPSTASAALPVLKPTLPQKIDPISATLRRLELVGRQATYLWTESHINLAGVPMGAVVPPGELPAVEHQLKTVSKAVEAVTNFAGSFATSALASGSLQSLDNLRTRIAGLQATFDQLAAQNAGLLSLPAAVLALLGTLTSSLGDVGTQLKQIHHDLLSQGPLGALNGPKTLAQYDALFVTIEKPSTSQILHDNDLFAAMRVAGPNPTLLQRATSLPAKFPLGNAQYQQVMGANDSLADAAAAGRLYLLDYEGLGDMAPVGPVAKPLTGTGYVYAPIALFARPKNGRSLVPVAIQCGQDPVRNPIFLRADDTTNAEAYWTWQSAKTAVQVADFNYHEMFVHLGRTHLMSEAFAMATQRQFATAHPLSRLLSPHLEGAMFINEFATLIIMAPLTTGDVILTAPIETLQHECGRDRLAYDFHDRMMLPNDLRTRGVDDATALPDYPYRDDALLVWNAIAQWVADYVAVYYPSDSDVTGDYELKAWATELATTGKVKGFRAIATRAQLVDVLTAIIFNTSAQHAAVNFPQYSVMTYAPFSAGAGGTPAPTTSAGQNEASWSQMLPSRIAAQEQILLFHILGGVYYRPLGEYKDNTFPHLPVLLDPAVAGPGGPLERFRTALAGIENTIRQRNTTRARPYEHLLPSRIPSSTNI